MHVVFLDIDGVLNTGRNGRKQNGRPRPFDPEAIIAVNRILAETGARIVVSSAWRIQRTVAELDELMMLEGLPRGSVLDSTPFLRIGEKVEFQPNQFLYHAEPRWKEIEAWLAEHPDVTRWVVIDDDEDARPDILCDFEQGLTIDAAATAIDILRRPRASLPALVPSTMRDGGV